MAHIKKGEERTVEEQQKDVLEAFGDTGNISLACKKARIPRRTFYNWMEKAAFKKQFKKYQALALGILEDEAMRRATQGTLDPVFYKGKKIGSVRKYSDTLLIVLLKANDPKKYRDRVLSELTGKDGKPIKTNSTTTVRFVEATMNL